MLPLFPVGGHVQPKSRARCERLAGAWGDVAAMVEALAALEPGSLADMLCRSIVASSQWRALRNAVRDIERAEGAHER